MKKYIYSVSVGGIRYNIFADDIMEVHSLIYRRYGERNDVCILSCRRNNELLSPSVD